MNPDTGHLIDLEKIDLKKLFGPDTYEEAGYIPIPPDLQRAAQIKLAGKPEAFVSRNSGGKLSNFNRHLRAMRRK